MSTTPEPPNGPQLQNLIHPNGVLNHSLYYRLLQTTTETNALTSPPETPETSSPTIHSSAEQGANVAHLHSTALRYLLSDLSYTDPHAMDLLVDPSTGGIKHDLYWEYTFKVHQTADGRAGERLTWWARRHSRFFGGRSVENQGGEARVQSGMVGRRGGGEVGLESSSSRLWRGAVLPFVNFAVGPVQTPSAERERQAAVSDGFGKRPPPPPYEP